MFSVITNIYNKKTKGPTLMELFTATGKLFSLNICRVYWLIKLTYIIAKHNGMAPIKHIMLLIRFIQVR
jgi:hypothetical protein